MLPEKFDRDIAPMAASTNATRVFWGTAWTSQTLLGRELRAARAAEQRDGLRRVFIRTADDVGAEVPAYARHVQETVARQGRTHPLVRTQYFSEEIDSEGGLFPPERIARIRGADSEHDVPPAGPLPGRQYALLLDVAGEDEGVRASGSQASLANPARDASALTLVEITPADHLPQNTGMLPLNTGVLPLNTGVLSQGTGILPLNTGVLSTTVDNFIHTPVDNPAGQEHSALPVYAALHRWQWLGARHTDQPVTDAVKLQAFLRKFVSGMKVQYLATNRLRVPYDPNNPPTIMINGCMLQAADNVDLPAGQFSGAAALYYVFANQSAGSTSFTLSVNTSSSETANQRIIGTAYWDGASVTTVTSYSYNPTGLAPADYDSGWFACAYNNTYTKAHSLGTTPRMALLIHNTAADGSGECVYVHTVRQATAIYQGALGYDSANVYVTAGAESTGGTVFSKRRESASGFYRILAWK